MPNSHARAVLASIMRNNPVASSGGPYDVNIQLGAKRNDDRAGSC